MITSLAYWFCQLLSIPIPDVALKGSTRIVLSAGTAMGLVLFLGPWVIARLSAMKFKQPIREDKGFLLGQLHQSKKETPTMGGILIIIAVALSSALFADWSSIFVLLLIGSLFFFGAIGAVDDWEKLKSRSPKGLPGKVRMALQTVWALFVICVLALPATALWGGFSVPALLEGGRSVAWQTWQAGVYMPFVSGALFIASGGGWLVIWGIQWLTMVGGANAVNLTDGLDGLAAGCSMMVAASLCMAALFCGHEQLASEHGLIFVQTATEVAVCLAALAGACCGFLWFNAYPAQVFMGDTGSLAVGGMLGTAAVVLKREWFLALVGAIFVVETLSVIVQVTSYRRSGKRIFLCTPLHHHFEYLGIHEAKVVIRFWITGLLLAVVGFLSQLR
jgi:phospho-N-acetylmuramoyl-pentapeptide-transferase